MLERASQRTVLNWSDDRTTLQRRKSSTVIVDCQESNHGKRQARPISIFHELAARSRRSYPCVSPVWQDSRMNQTLPAYCG